MTATKANTVRNAVDSWVDGSTGHTTKNYGAAFRLFASSTDATTLVYFGAPMPRGATVISAKLRLYTSGSFAGASVTLNARRLNAKFTASRVTWSGPNARPAGTGATATVTKTSTGDGDVFELDVKPIMQLVADGTPWYGFEVVTTTATRRAFRSAQSATLRPELEVTWADAPDAPTTMSPNGQAVSVSRPVVEGDYTDPTGGTLTSAMVELKSTNAGWDAVNGFAAPDFATVETPVGAGSKARLDLAAAASGWAGATAGSTWYYTMRVRDESGEWSEWSKVASFIFTAFGTLTINAPSVAAPTLNDFTPPVTFTVAGMTLEKYRVIVENVATGGVVYDSGEVPASGTSIIHTIAGRAGKALLKTGVSYLLRVRAFDTVDRSPTETPFVEATQPFTVVAGSTTAITGLTATSVVNPPGVQIDFSRAAAPDAFTFTVDGDVVEADVLPADVFVSGTSYRYTFTRLRPNVAASFGVAAIVNSTGASTVTAVSATPKVSGMWLVDKARDRYLFIAKTGGSKLDLGEESELLVPLGAEAGITITQSLRGYEGDVSGVLVNTHDAGSRTLQQWVDEALIIRSRPGRTYYLIVGTEAIECTVRNLSVRPTGDSTPGMRPISFSFAQTGEQRVAVAL